MFQDLIIQLWMNGISAQYVLNISLLTLYASLVVTIFVGHASTYIGVGILKKQSFVLIRFALTTELFQLILLVKTRQ